MKWILVTGLIIGILAACRNREYAPVQLRPSKTDSVQIARLQQEVQKNIRTQPDSAIQALQALTRYYRQYNADSAVIDCYMQMVFIKSIIQKDAPKAHAFADSLQRLAAHMDPRWAYRIHFVSGLSYIGEEDHENAIPEFLKAAKLQPQPMDTAFRVNIYFYLAKLYIKQDNALSAIRFQQYVVQYFDRKYRSGKDVLQYISAHQNMYCYLALLPDSNEQKRYHIMQAYDAARQIQDTPSLAGTYNYLADYYERSGQTDSALYYYHSALQMIRAYPYFLHNDPELCMLSLARIYIDKGDYTQASSLMEELINKKDPDQFDYNERQLCYYLIYKIHEHSKDYRLTMLSYEEWVAIKMQQRHKERERLLLNHEKELKKLAATHTISRQQNQIRQQRLYLIIALLSLLCLLAIIIPVYLVQRRRKKMMVQELLLQQQAKELDNERKLVEERSRIAREMHDDLGSTLTTTLMAAELIKSDPQAPEPRDMIYTASQNLSQQINEIIWNLNTRNDNVFNLVRYLEQYSRKFLTGASIRLVWSDNAEQDFRHVPGYARRNIYLTVKELLNNVVKHAMADTVSVDIGIKDGFLDITIEDNGIGIPVLTEEGTGNGLANIRHRVQSLGGTFSCRQMPSGPGTVSQIHIPLTFKEATYD